MKLSAKSRERWQMLGAHVASAYRLRRALIRSEDDLNDDTMSCRTAPRRCSTRTDLRIIDAIGPAKDRNAGETLRRAARQCRQSARTATQGRPAQSVGNLEGARQRTLERGGLV